MGKLKNMSNKQTTIQISYLTKVRLLDMKTTYAKKHQEAVSFDRIINDLIDYGKLTMFGEEEE